MKTKDLNEIQLVAVACNTSNKRIAISASRSLCKVKDVTKDTLLKVFNETKHDDVKGYLQKIILTTTDFDIHDFSNISKFKGSTAELIIGMNSILLRNKVDTKILVALSINDLDTEIARKSFSLLFSKGAINAEILYEIAISAHFEEVAAMSLRELFAFTNIRATLLWRLVRNTKHESIKSLAFDLYIKKSDSDDSVLSSLAIKCTEEGVSMKAIEALVKKAKLDSELLNKIANTATDEAVAMVALENLIKRDGSNEKLIKGVAQDSIYGRVVICAQKYLAENIHTSEKTLLYLSENGTTNEISSSAFNTLFEQPNPSEETLTYLVLFAQTAEMRLQAGRSLVPNFDLDPVELLDILRLVDIEENDLAVLISNELFSKTSVDELCLRGVVLLSKHFDIRIKAIDELNSKFGLSDDSLLLFSKENKLLIKHIKSKYLSKDNKWHDVYSVL